LPLTSTQKEFIARIDDHVKHILSHGGSQEALLISLHDKMNGIKNIIDSSSKEELNTYCEHYSGFYQYMILLEQLALAISKGNFEDLLK
jgi:hypothetical protein